MCLSVLFSDLSVFLWWIRLPSPLASARPSWWSQVGKNCVYCTVILELPVIRLLCCRYPQHYHWNSHNCKRSCWIPWKQNWSGQNLRDHQNEWLWVQVPLHQRVRSDVYPGSLHDSADHGRGFHRMERWVQMSHQSKEIVEKMLKSVAFSTISHLMSTFSSPLSRI